MKKLLILVVLVILAILIGLSVFLIVSFVRLAEPAQPETDPQAAQEVLDYAKEVWPDYRPTYEDHCLTLSQSTRLTYENACAFGGAVYCDELAPETYLPQARSIAIDVMGQCGCEGLNVILSYESTEGRPIFTVNSSGEIWVCWED